MSCSGVFCTGLFSTGSFGAGFFVGGVVGHGAGTLAHGSFQGYRLCCLKVANK
jgi:hypothetical protein